MNTTEYWSRPRDKTLKKSKTETRRKNDQRVYQTRLLPSGLKHAPKGQILEEDSARPGTTRDIMEHQKIERSSDVLVTTKNISVFCHDGYGQTQVEKQEKCG